MMSIKVCNVQINKRETATVTFEKINPLHSEEYFLARTKGKRDIIV